jgi:phage shock protein PspC (stress-responsive transcriptional regulator)
MDLELEDRNAVLLGVCAEFARWADVDPLLARVTASLVGLFLAPVAIPAYLVAGLALNAGRRKSRSTN